MIYFDHDGNGNVVLLTKSTDGTRAATYEYDPFGNEIRHSGLPIPNSAFSLADRNPFRFSTKFTDDETGLIYYGYRYYSPTMGRWMSRDPIEENAAVKLFAVSRNDVVNFVDLLGMDRPNLDRSHGDPALPLKRHMTRQKTNGLSP